MLLLLGVCLDGFHVNQRPLSLPPPDLEREKTLAEAKHEALIDDIEAHLTATKDALIQLANHQEALATELRGDQNPIEVQPEPNEQEVNLAPRDYADTRGQLRY